MLQVLKCIFALSITIVSFICGQLKTQTLSNFKIILLKLNEIIRYSTHIFYNYIVFYGKT